MEIKLPTLIDAIEPLGDAINSLTTSGEERGKLRVEYDKVKAQLITGAQALEKQVVQGQSAIVLAEAQGKSWLQRNWRPMGATAMFAIIVWNYACVILLEWIFAIVQYFTEAEVVIPSPPRLEFPAMMWTLLTIMIGGYVASRGVEKNAMIKAVTTGKLDFGKGAGGLIGKRERKQLLKHLSSGKASKEEKDRILSILENSGEASQ